MNQNMGNHRVVNEGTHHLGNEGSTGGPTNQHDAINSNLAMVMPNANMYASYAPRDMYHDYNGGLYNHKQQQYVHHMSKENGGIYDVPNNMYDHLTSPHPMSDPTLSPSPPPPPRVYRPCVVCLDKSSGYHYGVSSCEGCKGFFRRSVQKNMQYTCHKDKNCPINKVTRNRCQYCRLQKCFSSGMSREAVRNDRNKKRKKAESSSSSSSTTSTTNEEITEEENMLLQDVLEAHRLTCDTSPITDTNGVIENGEEKVTENGQDKDGGEHDNKDNNGSKLWDKISLLSSGGIVKIVDFAKKITGFSSLCTSDQITLLKAACLEIMILRLSFRYDPDLDAMVFSNKVCINKEQLEEGGFGALASTIFNFAASLKGINTDETEFAVLSAVCLVSGDRSGLKEVVKIEQLQETLLEALKHYVRSRRDDQPHVFAKLLMKLTDLRSISVKGELDAMLFAVNFMNDVLAPVEKLVEEESDGSLNGIRIIKYTSVDTPLPSELKKASSTNFNTNTTSSNFMQGYYDPYSMSFGSSSGYPSASSTLDDAGMRMMPSASISPMDFMSNRPSSTPQYSPGVYQQPQVSSTTTANGQPLTSRYQEMAQHGGATLTNQSSTGSPSGGHNTSPSAKYSGNSIECRIKVENISVPSAMFENYVSHGYPQGAERVLHLKLEKNGELPPLVVEMLDRTENVCIP